MGMNAQDVSVWAEKMEKMKNMIKNNKRMKMKKMKIRLRMKMKIKMIIVIELWNAFK